MVLTLPFLTADGGRFRDPIGEFHDRFRTARI
jgi:hypothetical protein